MPLAETLSNAMHHGDDTIAGERPSWYWRRGWIGAVALVAAEIILWYTTVAPAYTRIAEGVIFLCIGFILLRQRISLKASAYLGAHIGIIAGLVIVLFELVADPEVWRIFNIIARPMWMGAMGFVITGGFALLLSRLARRMKGGEHHG